MSDKKLVSSAANQVVVTKNGVATTLVVVDNCHFGRNMQAIFKLLREDDYDINYNPEMEDRGQGFIDESGNFMNRSEAYKLASTSGQPFNTQYVLPNSKLDSSCIRHFPAKLKLSSFCEKPWTPPQYVLKERVVGLTIGKVYAQHLPCNDEPIFNICVYNDNEFPQFVPLNRFKKVIA